MYNNPNLFQYPSMNLTKPSLFNFGEILNKTQKTLNIINQAIPIFYQVKPLWNNAKTILKIANIVNEKPTKTTIKSVNNAVNKKETNNESIKKQEIKYNEPVFFL